MRKVICSLLVCATLFSVSSATYAKDNEVVSEVDEVRLIEGKRVEVSSQIISVPEESDGLFGVRSAGTRSSSISNHKPLIGNYYTVAKSSATTKQDKIFARARLYNSKGVLWQDEDSTAKNSKFTSATARSSTFQINFNNAYSIGNHSYKRSGYKDTFHETKKNW
jgi:hypothetical protein